MEIAWVSYLMVKQDNRLHLVNPATGHRCMVGPAEWDGPVAMSSIAGRLRVIQNDRLHDVNPRNASWRELGNPDWPGSSFLVTRADQLFAINGSQFHYVDPDTGVWQVRGSEDWSGTSAMAVAGVGIFVIRSDELYFVTQVGRAARRLPKHHFYGGRCMAGLGQGVYFIRGVGLLRVRFAGTQQGVERVGVADWSGAQAMTSLDPMLYAVADRQLYSINPVTGVRRKLGKADWAGEISMTGITLALPKVNPTDSFGCPAAASGGLPEPDAGLRRPLHVVRARLPARRRSLRGNRGAK